MHTINEVMTSGDAARALGVHPNTLRDMIQAGRLTGYNLGKPVILCVRAEVEALRAKRAAAAQQEQRA